MNDRKDSLDTLLSKVNGKPEKEAAPEADGDEATDITLIGGSLAPANKTLTRVHVLKKDGTVRSYQYHFLDVLSVYEGGKFTLLFVGVKHWRLEVMGFGPKFWTAYDYLTQHRLRGLREATDKEAKFADRGATVFTDIRITDVTPKDHE